MSLGESSYSLVMLKLLSFEICIPLLEMKYYFYKSNVKRLIVNILFMRNKIRKEEKDKKLNY